MNHDKLHSLERPVAMLSSIYANSQRDPKKTQKSYSYMDFSFYKPVESLDVPQSHYGSAYAALVSSNRMPSWALFCFKGLMASVDEGYAPAEPGFVSEDAVLLHPEKVQGGYKGLLIAKESAGDQRRIFVNSKGEQIALTVPFIQTKVIAEEGVILTR